MVDEVVGEVLVFFMCLVRGLSIFIGDFEVVICSKVGSNSKVNMVFIVIFFIIIVVRFW